MPHHVRRPLYRCAILLLLAVSVSAAAQPPRQVTGTVSDEDGQILMGVAVLQPGRSVGTVTDSDGKYAITVLESDRYVYFYKSGYNTLQVPVSPVDVLDVALTKDIVLDRPTSLAARGTVRTELTAAVPVEVIPVAGAYEATGRADLNQYLTYASPNFVAQAQVLSGGSDFVDPAALRGLGPDQMLVLVNGKRRHKGASLHLATAPGRGTVGTDLDAIPIAAVDRVEILRDGAVAQYGTDAVAGVINVILKEDSGWDVQAIGGAHLTQAAAPVGEVVPALERRDGEFAQASLNYGGRVGQRGGYVNLTALGDVRAPTSRVLAYRGSIYSGYNNPDEGTAATADITEAELLRRGLTRADFNSRVGQAALRNGSLFANLSLPLGAATTVYLFGGTNYRRGETKGRYALPNAPGTVTERYPDGFVPELSAVVVDQSAAVGLRRGFGPWVVDLSHAFGRNAVEYELRNSNNASLGAASPSVFDVGEYAFAQNTSTLDVGRYFPLLMRGLQANVGAEYRLDAYRATAGQEASYRDYGAARRVLGPAGDSVLVADEFGPIATAVDALGRRRPGGVQGFRAIRPEDAGFVTRASLGGYVTLDADVSDRVAVGLAGRYERYADLGGAGAAKLSARWLINRDLSLRGSVSSDYRAPSLQQVAYAATMPGYADGAPSRSGTFPAGTPAAEALGIEALRPERSRSTSLGAVARLLNGRLGLSGDIYQVVVTDRIGLTDAFGAADEQRRDIAARLREVNVASASFFANAFDTETYGVDARVVYTTRAFAERLTLRSTLGGSYAQTTITRVRTSTELLGAEDTYLSYASQALVEGAVPRTQAYTTVAASLKRLELHARGTFFGFVREAAPSEVSRENLSGRIVADLSVTYRPVPALSVTLGANNVLDAYPERLSAPNAEGGRVLYSRTTQQIGTGGRYVFARVGVGVGGR